MRCTPTYFRNSLPLSLNFVFYFYEIARFAFQWMNALVQAGGEKDISCFYKKMNTLWTFPK